MNQFVTIKRKAENKNEWEEWCGSILSFRYKANNGGTDMRLKKVRVTKYRSIRDTGWFDVENAKTILVGPNEAGKTALLEALQQINPPQGVRRFDPLRDYPRSEFNDITTGKVRPEDVTVVEAHFSLEDNDIGAMPKEFMQCTYVYGRKLDNKSWHRLDGGHSNTTYGDIRKDLARLCAHIDGRVPVPALA